MPARGEPRQRDEGVRREDAETADVCGRSIETVRGEWIVKSLILADAHDSGCKQQSEQIDQETRACRVEGDADDVATGDVCASACFGQDCHEERNQEREEKEVDGAGGLPEMVRPEQRLPEHSSLRIPFQPLIDHEENGGEIRHFCENDGCDHKGEHGDGSSQTTGMLHANRTPESDREERARERSRKAADTSAFGMLDPPTRQPLLAEHISPFKSESAFGAEAIERALGCPANHIAALVVSATRAECSLWQRGGFHVGQYNHMR